MVAIGLATVSYASQSAYLSEFNKLRSQVEELAISTMKNTFQLLNMKLLLNAVQYKTELLNDTFTYSLLLHLEEICITNSKTGNRACMGMRPILYSGSRVAIFHTQGS